jgi:ATP-dependent Clp protease ATP-binding subunit ClpA
MFSKDLEQTIGQCYKRAREARHEFMTVEHLLLALLDNVSAQAVLKACGGDAPRLRTTGAIPSPRWDSSACCSGRSTMCSPRARRR